MGHPSRWVARLVLSALGLWWAWGQAAVGSETGVLVVLSHSGEPYATVHRSVTAGLMQAGVFPDAVSVEELGTLRARVEKGPPQLFIALGSAAAEAVTSLDQRAPVVEGMILAAEAGSGSAPVTTISLAFPADVQLDWIHRVLPRARVVGVICGPSCDTAWLNEAGLHAAALGMRLEVRVIRSPTELPQALEAVADVADLLWAVPDSMVYTPQTTRHILLSGFRNKIPLIGLSEAWVKAGALYALTWDYSDIGAQCAERALAVLGGKDAAALPMVGPRAAVVVLNKRTAEHMKADIPPEVRAAARMVE